MKRMKNQQDDILDKSLALKKGKIENVSNLQRASNLFLQLNKDNKELQKKQADEDENEKEQWINQIDTERTEANLETARNLISQQDDKKVEKQESGNKQDEHSKSTINHFDISNHV